MKAPTETLSLVAHRRVLDVLFLVIGRRGVAMMTEEFAA
jgi:hypothetical protein